MPHVTQALEDLLLMQETIELECKLAQGQNGLGEVPKDLWPICSVMVNAHPYDLSVVLRGSRHEVLLNSQGQSHSNVFCLPGAAPTCLEQRFFGSLSSSSSLSEEAHA